MCYNEIKRKHEKSERNDTIMSMRKIIALLLVLSMAVFCAACGGKDESEASEASAEKSAEASGKEESSAETAESSEETAESSEAEESSETSGEEDPLPEFCKNFLTYGEINANLTATSPTAIRLTGVNVPLTYGAVVLYTYLYEDEFASEFPLSDFAGAVFEYDPVLFNYVESAYYEAGSTPDDIEVPEDGFLVLAHKAQEKVLKGLSSLTKETPVFPHGVQPCEDIGFTIKKTSAKMSIDGKYTDAEWKDFHIDSVDADNTFWSYAQFEKDNYYSTAEYYASYDDEYLYLCVVVTSPYHYCPITQEKAGDMWQYECIQVKFCAVSPASAYILENFDHMANKTAVNDGVVRSYGFAANDENETCFYESGFTTTFTGLAGCHRYEDTQNTVYEVALPWAECSISPEKGLEIGLTFSVNSTNADDIDKGVWKNITFRNGGGIITRNDWTKIPPVTLG